MIAVDTNVLVRLLISDDRRQHDAAKAFFGDRLSAGSPGFISLVVIAETCWVLNSAYKFGPDAVRAALLGVIDSQQVVVERPAIARASLAHDPADFADWLIHLVGREAGCRSTVTFDKRFARHADVELLG